MRYNTSNSYEKIYHFGGFNENVHNFVKQVLPGWNDGNIQNC